MNFIVCILHHDFDQSDSVFYSVFEDDESSFVFTLHSCHLGHVVYSGQKVKASEILSHKSHDLIGQYN